MEESVRDAVFGNIGTMVAFRVGAEDAEFLEKEFTPELSAADLVNLAKYNIYLKLMIDGVSGRPFSAETLLPFERPEKSSRDKIIKVSRERYGTSQKIVEDKIIRWTGDLSQETMPQKPVKPVLYDAKCSLCNKAIKVVFPPDKNRPVYCKPCLKKIKEAGDKPVSKAPSFSLKEAVRKEPISFSSSRKAKRKEVNLKELKEVLEESLKKKK